MPNIKTKINLLAHLLENEEINRAMIFTRSRKNAESVYSFLERKHFGEIRVIHANKGQNTRINSMEDFKAGDVRLLVATDVAARGLDVTLVSHVINFDVPLIYEDYVHRIGRTGRAEQVGESITFITLAETYHWHKIEEIIQQKIEITALPDEIKVEETPFLEHQDMLRSVDEQRKREDPDFKGAFHDKKWVIKARANGNKAALRGGCS